MKVSITRLAYYGFGASPIFTPVGKALSARLGDYGDAIQKISVDVYIPNKSEIETGFNFLDDAPKLPSVRFYRKKCEIKLSYLDKDADIQFESREPCIEGCNSAMPSMLEAFRLIQSRIKSTDHFAYNDFITDVEAFLELGFTSNHDVAEAAGRVRPKHAP